MRLFWAVSLLLLLFSPAVDAAFAKAAGKSKKPKKAAKSSSGGFGAKTAVAAGPTVAQLLKKSTETYEQLERAMAKQNMKEAEDEFGEGSNEESSSSDSSSDDDGERLSVTKWCVALRSEAAQEFSDWVPVALLALGCTDEAGDPKSLVPSAVGASCREIVEGTLQEWPSLKKVGRETLQYSYEPLDSFENHVYEGMTMRTEKRKDAMKELGLEAGWSAGDLKKAHRKLMMELHPDKFILEGGAVDEEGLSAAKERMNAVQEAYGILGGGQGAGSGSFYESIGGKARTEFSGVLPTAALKPLGKTRPEQEKPYEEGGWRAGVIPMAPTVSKEFIIRNRARKGDD